MSAITCSAIVAWGVYSNGKSYEKALASAPPICLAVKTGEVFCGKQTKLRGYLLYGDSDSFHIDVEGRGEMEIPLTSVAWVGSYNAKLNQEE
jgi:hypothetical protein